MARAGIDRVDHLLITHWHPDHTAGFRVVEQLSFDLASGGARQCIPVYLNAETERRHADSWRYFERRGYCQLNIVGGGAAFDCGPLRVRTSAYAPGGYLLGFVLADGEHRVVLALDETKGLATALPALAREADLLIAECGFFSAVVPPHWPMRRTEACFEVDTLALVRAVGARRTILTHILGCLVGHTPDELSRRGHDFEFAYDGIALTV